jgi:hypothetical protein
MRRGPNDQAGYFALAGEHWFPRPSECLHHEDRFAAWHRVYLMAFEDALRSVPGAESITLPYWDITDLPPAFLFDPPFNSYTLPAPIHANYPAGYATTRSSREAIAKGVADYDIPGIIAHALKQPTWDDFSTSVGRGLEAAHDAGHVVTGLTMKDPDAAAFDPIFWLFHADWDRLWWQWQQIMSATTLTTFRSTVIGSTDFLTPGFNELPPFEATTDQTIDLSQMGVSYTLPVAPAPDFAPTVSRTRDNLPALEGVRLPDRPQAAVRLQGIDRLAIPGSFRAILHADGDPIARRAFFQSTEPLECANCRERAKISLDFLVDADQVLGKTLTSTIEVITSREGLDPIPREDAGQPSLSVRLVLEQS